MLSKIVFFLEKNVYRPDLKITDKIKMANDNHIYWAFFAQFDKYN